MRNPILLVIEDRDMEAFETVTDLEIYLEPVDVRCGLYKVYDADGRQLRIEILPDSKSQGILRGLFSLGRECVSISEDLHVPVRGDELNASIRRYLTWVGRFSEEEVLKMSLAELIRYVPISAEMP